MIRVSPELVQDRDQARHGMDGFGRTSYLSRSVAFALSLWRTLVFCVSTQPSEGGSERSPGMAAGEAGVAPRGWSESGQVGRKREMSKERGGRTAV